MRKLLLLTAPAFLLSLSSVAQSYNSSLNFQKNRYAVASVQVPFDEDVVTAAVKDYMAQKGFKDARYKDFVVFRSVPLTGPSPVFYDAYFNIDRKSRSEKDISVVSLLAVKKGQTLLPTNVEDSSFLTNSLAFLDSLRPYILHYSLQQEILAQQKLLEKTKSKLISLKNDSGDIAKKIRSYEAGLAENKIDQDKQTREINDISTGDQGALAKAHKRMDKLMDRQTDYEKKLRNSRQDMDQTRKDLYTQQTLFDKQSQALDALQQRQQGIRLAGS